MNQDNNREIISKLKNEISCSAHNIDHVERVYQLSKHISKEEEGVNEGILIPAALLHDIARHKEDNDETGEIDHAIKGAKMAEDILKDMNYSKNQIQEVKHCIRSHRFRSGVEPDTIEAKILFDADKIDAIGAVGIGRCFMLAGQFDEKLFSDQSLNEYINNNVGENGRLKDISKHSPNIEYEIKLKNIPDRLLTDTGKKIAEERMAFMEEFFERLEEEVKGGI